MVTLILLALSWQLLQNSPKKIYKNSAKLLSFRFKIIENR